MILDDHDTRADRKDLRVARVGVEVFCPSTHGEHDLTDPTRTYRPGHAPDFPHDLVRDGLRLSAARRPSVPGGTPLVTPCRV